MTGPTTDADCVIAVSQPCYGYSEGLYDQLDRVHGFGVDGQLRWTWRADDHYDPRDADYAYGGVRGMRRLSDRDGDGWDDLLVVNGMWNLIGVNVVSGATGEPIAGGYIVDAFPSGRGLTLIDGRGPRGDLFGIAHEWNEEHRHSRFTALSIGPREILGKRYENQVVRTPLADALPWERVVGAHWLGETLCLMTRVEQLVVVRRYSSDLALVDEARLALPNFERQADLRLVDRSLTVVVDGKEAVLAFLERRFTDGDNSVQHEVEIALIALDGTFKASNARTGWDGPVGAIHTDEGRLVVGLPEAGRLVELELARDRIRSRPIAVGTYLGTAIEEAPDALRAVRPELFDQGSLLVGEPTPCGGAWGVPRVLIYPPGFDGEPSCFLRATTDGTGIVSPLNER
ncbi:hypothetical protein [Engelhardtia mirabilis]|uniref:hypothetical protein n=1 Tax=Engelhardtia mirabilis TaxID=2528011 RepID=UPI0011A9354F